jgi:hypothetical protein
MELSVVGGVEAIQSTCVTTTKNGGFLLKMIDVCSRKYAWKDFKQA